MASDLDNLKAERSALIAKILALATADKVKPSYSIDGQSVQWVEWQRWASDRVDALTKLIQQLEPYMIVSRGRS